MRRSPAKWKRSTRLALLAAGLIAVFAMRAGACPVCMSLPTRTASDAVIESETVVFARENPDEPFSYRPVDVLKGDAVSDDIDLFLDSTTRRRLKANPSHVVVLVRKSKDARWKSLGIADDDYKAVIRRVLLFSNEWAGREGRTKRHEFFLSLFGHQNRAIFELAYLELGRAPYSTIQRAARSISPDVLRPILRKREYIQWRSLAILMLAQNAREQDRRLIEDSFDACRRFSLTTNLAAWATAHVELNGSSAVDAIERDYLGDANRTEAEIRAVIMALSVHGRDGRVHLRDRIVRSYGVALRFHPGVAGPIAVDLTDWKRWEYREDIAKILEKSHVDFESPEAQAIRNYVQ